MEETQKAYNTLDPAEKLIVSKDSNFYTLRLQDILRRYFEPMFPDKSTDVMLRIIWFFNEMSKLAVAKHMEDSEWYHNRNEDDPAFDDFKWWANFEAKVKEEFPDGIFTEKTFQKLHEWFDARESEFMVQFWKEHPKEFEKLKERIH